jgi:hypothetical protein
MHKVRGNYSNCTCRSSEKICSSSGGAEEKGKTGSKRDETQIGTKSGAFLSLALRPLKANVLFCKFFLNFTLFWTKLRVLVPCFPDFTANYNKVLNAIIILIAQNQKWENKKELIRILLLLDILRSLKNYLSQCSTYCMHDIAIDGVGFLSNLKWFYHLMFPYM